jgi:hypothetical protein
MVSETLRFPFRAVVASSSAIRSSRSAQQSPPRSAACAGSADHATAVIARRLKTGARAAGTQIFKNTFNFAPSLLDRIAHGKSELEYCLARLSSNRLKPDKHNHDSAPIVQLENFTKPL